MNKNGVSEGLWYAIAIFLTALAIVLLILFGGFLRDRIKDYVGILMDFLRL